MVILRPIRQVGWLSASSTVTPARASARQVPERPARGGEDQPAHLATDRAGAGTGGWRCARCRPAARRRRARGPASITRRPAITSTSLLASAMRLPARIAASTASSAAVPDEAHSTVSTSSRVTSSISACGPARAQVEVRAARRSAAAPAARPGGVGGHADGARPVALDLQRHAPRRSRRRRAPTTSSRSGCASTTASALWPIEPVEPRMARRIGAAAIGHYQPGVAQEQIVGRERRTAARRCDRGCRRGRGSGSTSP